MSKLTGSSDASTVPSGAYVAGPRPAGLPDVERYTVLESLGAGAMGEVFAAYDAVLDRKVAVKILPAHLRGSAHRDQLLLEARTLAKLAHPNVVAVYDVGETRGNIFFAMEFVRGQNLVAWLRQPRSPEAIAVVFRDAALGLAAAHNAGLVHRDVKPQNLLMGEDGRVRVADFGLAIVYSESVVDVRKSDDKSKAMSSNGEFAGSPAYMAPEQLRTEPVDGRTDQFGLCVTLFEALYGHRPFVDTGNAVSQVAGLLAAMQAGPARSIVSDARGDAVPLWLATAVRRGLALQPVDRFTSCRELADALQPPEPTRRRGLVVAGVVAVIAASIAAFFVMRDRHETAQNLAPTCDGVTAALDSVWTTQAKVGLAQGLDKAAPGASVRLIERIDSYAQEWKTTRVAACQSARIEHVWPSELEAAAQRCLDARLVGFVRTVEALTTDAAAAKIGRGAIAGLRSSRPCGDPDYLRSAAELIVNPAKRGQLTALVDKLEALQIDRLVGRNAAVAKALPALSDEATELEHAGAIALVNLLQGDLARDLGDMKTAITKYTAGYVAARAGRAPESAAMCATALVWEYGLLGEQAERASDWAAIAHAEASTIKDGGVQVAAEYASGALADRRGDLPAATLQFRNAVELAMAHYGPEHYITATMQSALASVLGAAGKFDQAVAPHRAAIAVLERWEGPDGRGVSRALGNLALTESSAGLLADAETHAQRALTISLASKDPERMGTAHHNLAAVLNKAGRRLDAVDHWQQAEKIFAEAELAGAAAAAVVARIASDDVTEDVVQARAKLTAARTVLVEAYGADASEVADADAALAARKK